VKPALQATLAFDRTGSGEPLVLMHPLGADRGVWEPVMDLLGAHHDTIAVDMPGFGESPETPPDAPPTAREMAHGVLVTLDQLGIERAHVAGISLGGWVALEFAKTERCLSVTALCAAGFWPRPLGPRPEVARSTARRLMPLMRPLLQRARGRRLMLQGAVARPDRVPPDAAYRLVRAYALSPGFERANAEMRRTLFSGFEEIRVPVTLAWAEFDRSVAPPRGGLPPSVQTAFLAGCGHVPTWDDPEQVAGVILTGTGRAHAPSGAMRA
jgi:pimeloyl-ACP methyl ester carboxylesterase